MEFELPVLEAKSEKNTVMEDAMGLVIFAKVPVDAECYILDHMADEIRYQKINYLGISGMVCNAVKLPEGTLCWVPLDKEVHYDPQKSEA